MSLNHSFMITPIMSGGESPEEAVHNAYDAIEVWIEAASELGRDVPAPSQKLTFA